MRHDHRMLRVYSPGVFQPGGADVFLDPQRTQEPVSKHEPRRDSDAIRARERRGDVVRAENVNWFSDEVVVDFPSMDAVVDRIREQFVGLDDGAASHSAEILLTPRDAFRGVRVPLQVPIRRTCQGCGGRGEVWTDRCPDCSGSGDALGHYEVQLSVPAGVRHGTQFRFCVTPRSARPTLVEITIAIA